MALDQNVHLNFFFDVGVDEKFQTVVNAVDDRRFKVDVFVIRNVIEERFFGRDGKRRNGFASTSVYAKIFNVVDNVTTNGDKSKSRVDVDLAAVLGDTARYHGVLFKADQKSKVSEVYFVLVRVNPTRVVVSVLFQSDALLFGQQFRNHVKRFEKRRH